MGFQLQLSGFCVFLLLTLSLGHSKNVTVKVIGVMHCTDCIGQASSGINVVISCKSKNRQTNTEANGNVDKEGKFTVMLSADITNDGMSSIDGCFAKLHSGSPEPCPIQSPQTASVKLSIEENATQAQAQATQNKPTVIKFSPGTCQSAFFWPFIKPNIPLFPGLYPPPRRPIDYIPPPSEAFPPLAPSAQPPAPAVAPPYDPPVSSLPPPPAPTSQSPQSPPNPTFGNPPPPPLPPQDPPSYEPIPPPPRAFRLAGSPPPTPILPLTPPRKQPNPPPSPNPGKPIDIPRAPPVPQLPQIPKVPRKYFKPPKPNAQSPRSPYPSHS